MGGGGIKSAVDPNFDYFIQNSCFPVEENLGV